MQVDTDSPDEEREEGTLLSFRPLGRILQPEGVAAEFAAMRQEIVDKAHSKALKKVEKKLDGLDEAARATLVAEASEAAEQVIRSGVGDPETFARIGVKSGTHTLKLITPKAPTENSILRFTQPFRGDTPTFIPSCNAPDIPFAKIVYRPLELEDRVPRSLVDHILSPDNVSPLVTEAFAKVFGEAHLAALREALLGEAIVDSLPEAEFPVIFLPGEHGDIQITPVSPAAAYMALKRVTDRFFLKQPKDGPKVPRGEWSRQVLSSKPQNISGAIGGPRVRFRASMPSVMAHEEAELFRFIRGGGFPRLVSGELEDWIMSYADWLDADERYNNSDTRAALDRIADGLIKFAKSFVVETLREAASRISQEADGPEKVPALPEPPPITKVLLRRRWSTRDRYDRAVNALASPHFSRRQRAILQEENA
jgi:hypothetical protein